MGNSTLAGLLNSRTVAITAAQLLNLAAQPIQLCAPSAPGSAVLLKSLILSLRFGTTPYVQPAGAALVAFYEGPGRVAAFGAAGSQGPFFSITSVANASGGNTQYIGTITGGANNAYAGLYVDAAGYTNNANDGHFLCVASTATSITLANSGGVQETAPGSAYVGIELPAGSWGCGIGGGSDASPILLATQSEVMAYGVTSWNLPASEISGSSIVLGNPLPAIGSPANFTTGDGGIFVTVEYLSVQL